MKEGIFDSMEEKIRYENREQVLALDKTCTDLRTDDETNYEGFIGPLDRFQWRTTASYFMCAFAIKVSVVWIQTQTETVWRLKSRQLAQSF